MLFYCAKLKELSELSKKTSKKNWDKAFFKIQWLCTL